MGAEFEPEFFDLVYKIATVVISSVRSSLVDLCRNPQLGVCIYSAALTLLANWLRSCKGSESRRAEEWCPILVKVAPAPAIVFLYVKGRGP
jgi:hypothetical protein